MSKMLLGFVLGLGVGVAGVLLLQVSREGPSVPPISGISAATDDSTHSEEGILAPVVRVVTDDDAQRTGSSVAPQPVVATPSITPLARMPVQEAPVPIPVTPEIERLMGSNAVELHTELERESYDPVWAPNMEVAFYNFVADRPELLPPEGTKTIQCRTTICEIQIVNNTIDSGRWASQFMQSFAQEPGVSELQLGGLRNSADSSSQAGIWFFRRSPAE